MTKTKLYTWSEWILINIFRMKEEEKKVECTNCTYGKRTYPGTDEIRGVTIEANEHELKNVKCPDCGKPSLVRIEKKVT